MKRFSCRCYLAASIAILSTLSRTTAFSASRFDKVAASSPPKSLEKLMPQIETIDLGEDKLVSILVPPDDLNRQKSGKTGMKIRTNDGTGDVVWPSSFALARLIAHCPSLTEGKSVLELGSGLGLVSAAMCKHARPEHVALSDRDSSVLSMAYASCTQLNKSRASVSRCTMDWKDSNTWPNQSYDVLIGSDILYEKSSILPLVNVMKAYLCHGGDKSAIIVDPVNQVNRDAFCYTAQKAGLDVDMVPFPGMDDFVLLKVSRIE